MNAEPQLKILVSHPLGLPWLELGALDVMGTVFHTPNDESAWLAKQGGRV